MQIKLRTGSNQALGYRKWLHLIKWAISFKMSMFLLISKSVTFVNLQSLTLCSRKQNASSVVDLKPNQFPALYWPKFSAKFSLNNRFCEILSKESKDEWQHFFTQRQQGSQDQRSLARKYNKIGDETKHGHNNMITKYSFSFRVLTSKLTKLQIFCHIWIGPHTEFIYWKKLNKLSNNGDKLITTSFFVCPNYLQAFGEWSLPIDWLLCAVLILSVFSCLLWAIKNWIWGVQLP